MPIEWFVFIGSTLWRVLVRVWRQDSPNEVSLTHWLEHQERHPLAPNEVGRVVLH